MFYAIVYLNFILSSKYIKFHITYHFKMMNEGKSFAFTGLAKKKEK